MNIESIANLVLGHESSFQAGILHRDVLIGNIMLTENEDDTEGKLGECSLGMLTTGRPTENRGS